MGGGHRFLPKWDNTRNKCQNHSHPRLLRSAAGSLYWPLQARPGQALKLKGYIKSKVPRCSQPTMFLESQLSQVYRRKELSFSLQGLLAWIKMCNHIILPRGPFQLLIIALQCTAQQKHDMFPLLADHISG